MVLAWGGGGDQACGCGLKSTTNRAKAEKRDCSKLKAFHLAMGTESVGRTEENICKPFYLARD